MKFRRQHPLNKYIADYYCHERKLVIELDGTVYNDKMSKDYEKSRTDELTGSGIKVVRFWNNEIENDIGNVLNQIKEHLKNK